VKSRRLQEIIAIFREGQLRQNEAEIGKIHLVSCSCDLCTCVLPSLVFSKS